MASMCRSMSLIVIDSDSDDIDACSNSSAETTAAAAAAEVTAKVNSTTKGSSLNAQNDKEEDDDIIEEKVVLKPKRRKYEYEAVDENPTLDAQIDEIKRINDLTSEQIEYMVLRDVNYYLDIFAGDCEHSWRHREYKKFSRKTSNMLYENSRLCAYTNEQYMGAVRALQFVFCKKDYRYNEYIVKVLLPEALIKICMRVYQCSKDAAEEFLSANFDKNPNNYPKDAVVVPPPISLKQPQPQPKKSQAEEKVAKAKAPAKSTKAQTKTTPKKKTKTEKCILLN